MYIIENYIYEKDYQSLWNYANELTEGFLGENVSDYYNAMKDALKKAKDEYNDKLSIYSGLLDVHNRNSSAYNNTMSSLGTNMRDSLQKAKEELDIAKEKLDNAESTMNNFNHNAMSTTFENIKFILSGAVSSIVGFLKNNWMYLGIGVLGVILTTLAYRIYKSYKEKNNEERGINSAIVTLRNHYNKCSSSKDPSACKEKIKSLISKWEAKKKKVTT